jgi:hypothetical protein
MDLKPLVTLLAIVNPLAIIPLCSLVQQRLIRILIVGMCLRRLIKQKCFLVPGWLWRTYLPGT